MLVDADEAATELDQLHRRFEGRAASSRLLQGDVRDVHRFANFHADRCAVCGQTSDQGLVVDHDHWSGLVRGLLCFGCNHFEGSEHGDRVVFSRYRRRPPARMLGYFEAYQNAGLSQLLVSLRRREREWRAGNRSDAAQITMQIAALLASPAMQSAAVEQPNGWLVVRRVSRDDWQSAELDGPQAEKELAQRDSIPSLARTIVRAHATIVGLDALWATQPADELGPVVCRAAERLLLAREARAPRCQPGLPADFVEALQAAERDTWTLWRKVGASVLGTG